MAFQCDPSCDFSTSRTKAHLLHHIKQNIPTRITYDEHTRILPSREDFLNTELRTAVSAAVNARKPIIFMPNAISEKNEYVRDGSGQGVPTLRIHVYGTLPCGSKTCIILEDIPVYTLVALPAGMPKDTFKALITDMVHTRGVNVKSYEWKKLYKIRGFQRDKWTWLCCSFNSLQDRKKFLDNIGIMNKSRKAPIETANDDTGFNDFYFQVVARQHKFNTADWNRIEKYSVDDNTLPHCAYTLRVSLSDYKKLDAPRRKQIIEGKTALSDVITRDNTLQGSWDIETWQKVQTGQPADPNSVDDYRIFMMCCGWAWQWEKNQFVNYCFVDVPTPARDDVNVVIVCATEKEVLLGYTEMLSRMAPDILTAFNGGNFDWPCYRAKMRHHGWLHKIRDALACVRPWAKETEDSINKWSFRKESVKIDAENNHDLDCVATFPGVIDTDVLPIFLRLYSRAEVPKLASMNFFLAKNKLPSKADMPYKRMFRIYERAKKFQLLGARKVACHCDANGCSRPIVIDKDEPKGSPRRCCDCKNHVLQLDYKPKPGFEGEFPEDENYSDVLNDNIDERCCWCTKREQNLADMGDVAYYCVIDCLRPQQLCSKRVIVPEKRELSTMSCVSLYDSYYRADGMKVRNVIGKYAHKFDIAFSNARVNKSASEKDHYPGAWVCIPERELNFDDPVSGMDYSSLYPSLMMTYNLSIDMVVYTKEEADKLREDGYIIHQVGPFNYERGEKRGNAANKHLTATGWMVRHSGIMKPTDTRTITTYSRVATWKHTGDPEANPTVTYTSEDVNDDDHDANIAEYESRGYKVSYEYKPVYGREKLPGERMGLFPYILQKLFDKRKPVKAKFLYWSNIIDMMEKAGAHEWTVDGAVLSADDLDFNKNTVDSKQKAIKVLANTFYGESGNFRSPIFELLVAAGTTTAGVANITRVRHMVMARGCHVHYGDTDSLYISPPRRLFMRYTNEYECKLAQIHSKHRAIGAKYDTDPEPGTPEAAYKRERIEARLVLMEQKVKLTMKYMNDLKAHISLFLMRDNGTCFLNMAYEEVGLPTWFLGKKKYIMAAHMEVINFYPKAYFMRGIDIIKQGQTALSIEIGERFIRENMLPENEETVMPKMERELARYCATDHPAEKFAQKAKYKPEKKNVPVLTFVERMKIMAERYRTDETLAKVYALPEPGDKFTYVIVKKETPFSIRGKRVELKKGDRMEFLRALIHSRVTANPLQIDKHWYMDNSISGILARFLSGQPQFAPPEGKYDVDTKEGYRKMDEECIKLASAWIMDRVNNLSGFDPNRDTNYGKAYRPRYNAAKKQIVADAVERYGGMGEFYYNVIDVAAKESPTMPPLNKFVFDLKEYARAVTAPPDVGETIISDLIGAGMTPFRVWQDIVSPRNKASYYSVLSRQLDRSDKEAEETLYRVANIFAGAADNTINRMQTIIDSMCVTGSKSVDEDDIAMVNEWENPTVVQDLYVTVQKLRANQILRLIIGEVTRAAIVAKEKAAHVHAVPVIVDKHDKAAAARADAKKTAARSVHVYEWD